MRKVFVLSAEFLKTTAQNFFPPKIFWCIGTFCPETASGGFSMFLGPYLFLRQGLAGRETVEFFLWLGSLFNLRLWPIVFLHYITSTLIIIVVLFEAI